MTGKQHQNVTKNSIIRIYNKNWSCDRAIFILHDSWVGCITEKLYFSSMNGTIQWLCPLYIVTSPYHFTMAWNSRHWWSIYNIKLEVRHWWLGHCRFFRRWIGCDFYSTDKIVWIIIGFVCSMNVAYNSWSLHRYL